MRAFALFSSVFLLGACTTYEYAQNVKLVSFEDDVSPGKSVGPIRGDDCNWMILGYWIGGMPTLDQAFANARTQTRSSIGDAFGGSKATLSDKTVRYMTNVHTGRDGFNAGVIGKNCLTVSGTGYR